MVVSMGQPLRVENIMRPRPMSNRTSETITVHDRRADGIETTSTKTPSRNTGHVELRSQRHVVQHTRPQSIRRLRVSRVSRAIRRTGDLNDNRRPATVDNLMAALAVVRTVSVKTGHEQHDRHGVLCAGFFRYADVGWDFPAAVVAGVVRVWNHHFFEDWVPQRCCLYVDLLLVVEGPALDGGLWACVWTHVWET